MGAMAKQWFRNVLTGRVEVVESGSARASVLEDTRYEDDPDDTSSRAALYEDVTPSSSGGGGASSSLPLDIAGAGDFTVSPDDVTTWGVRADGTEFLVDSPAPVDADIANGERRQWFDGTVGALRFAERLLDGTLKKGRSSTIPYDPVTTPGVVVNRAGGFASEWQTFDLGRPGVANGIATITAADGDGLAWDADVSGSFEVAVSNDGVTWIPLYDTSHSSPIVGILQVFGTTNPDPVGEVAQYLVTTPRFARFRVTITDLLAGTIYAGAGDPTLTVTFVYSSG